MRQFFTAFFLFAFDFSVGGFALLVLEPFQETERNKKMFTDRPDRGQAFVGRVLQFFANRMNGDDAGFFQVLNGPFRPALAKAGKFG